MQREWQAPGERRSDYVELLHSLLCPLLHFLRVSFHNWSPDNEGERVEMPIEVLAGFDYGCGELLKNAQELERFWERDQELGA